MIHVPSLSHVSIEPSCWGGLYLCFNFEMRAPIKIYFGSWEACKVHVEKAQSTLANVKRAIRDIPLFEEQVVVAVSSAEPVQAVVDVPPALSPGNSDK